MATSAKTEPQGRPDDLDIRPIGGQTGALISGVTLSGDLPAETIATIRAALVQYKVVFFRGQNQMADVPLHQAFTQRFGALQDHPFAKTSPVGYAIKMDSKSGSRANTWHTDMTYLDAYPAASVLYGELIPPAGGDTMWANMAAAYASLPEQLQRFAEGLRVVHTNSYSYASERRDIASQQIIDSVPPSGVLEAEHPLVRVHPESGERSLVLGTFFSHFVDFEAPDSQMLYNLFMRHATRPENTIRWNWSVGDVAMWDNRATMHYGVNDYGQQQRIVRRMTIAGDAPVSVDGRSSVLRIPGMKD
ncbi:TauD/TfdA dioxygenase family protein [Sphingobium estronivorans]|uniref:TauD/TfdA dioxygenase family protein n=1 Tax=Sphingobium estronivorans TaxID=1577690 RepID=UPI001238A2B1|nr:TauD/TfdA family dioxygenase [Sphingobium estronivorans]